MTTATHALTLAEYLALPAVSSHRLWALHHRSPWHARYSEQEQTEAKDKGTLLHALVLEPESVESRFHRFVGEKRTKEAKEEWERAEAQGLVVVRADAWDEVEAEAGRVRAAVAPLLDAATGTERVLLWTDPETGLGCKARADLLLPDGMADLKRFSRSAHPRSFVAACATYGSHFQAAWYMRGARILGLPCSRWRWIAVEANGPVTVYEARPEDLLRTERVLLDTLARWCACERDGVWPAYEGGALDLSAIVAGEEPDFSDIELEEEEVP